jgi:hypothetical protein
MEAFYMRSYMWIMYIDPTVTRNLNGKRPDAVIIIALAPGLERLGEARSPNPHD